jgi:DNA-binding NarL/FixJ family response regulator
VKTPAPKTNPARILIVDDHPMVRERLAEVINQERDLSVVADADSAARALELAAAQKFDLAIIDLSLRESHGLDLIKDLQARHPKLRLLVVSMHDESLFAERAMRAGASGYINKQEATRNIIAALRTILAGQTYLSAKTAQELARRVLGRPATTRADGLDALTDRELQVFQLLGQGHALRHIAGLLGLDVSTVETYRNRVKEKLNLRDANEVLRRAIAWNQANPSGS